MYKKQDYSYILPKELIAEEAAEPPHNAKMMVIDRDSGKIQAESIFWNLNTIIPDNRVLYFNNSRVIKARITLKNIHYTTPIGEAKILDEGEIFYLKTREANIFEALVRPGNKLKIGVILQIGNFSIEVLDMTPTGRVLKIQNTELTIHDLLAQHGALPLPPYIEYSEEKEKDYQTVFAKKDGSVAAPTASLHFTEALLEKIKNEKKYVTLHVGLGTFKGLDTDDIREYDIHSESIEVSTQTLIDIATIKQSGKKIVAVGTTACRTLESLPALWKKLSNEQKSIFDPIARQYWEDVSKTISEENGWIDSLVYNKDEDILGFETTIYITPGYTFQIVDDLITNFHLPESSLLVLVSAFIGHRETLDIYKTAIEKKYRFYSFGDGMYIQGKD